MYRFYSQPMATHYTVLETSAWALTPKAASLSQGVFRSFQNFSATLPNQDNKGTLDDYTERLRNSGYNRRQIRHIMLAD